MSVQQQYTAVQAVNDVAIRLGLISGAQAAANPFESTDPLIGQLCALLDDAGQMLTRARKWSHLEVLASTAFTSGIQTYDLGTGDFDSLVDQTLWNSTTKRPIIGPVDVQTWQAITVRNLVTPSDKIFRLRGAQADIYPTPTTTDSFTYRYMSANWVGSANGAAQVGVVDSVAAGIILDGNTTNTPNYLVLFDPPLVRAALALLWKQAKGMDTTAAQVAYDRAFDDAASRDGASPKLAIAGDCGLLPWRMIGYGNLPDSGYGG